MALDIPAQPTSRRRAISRPLTPVTYLVRNMGKTLPLIGVIVLAVLLISGIISLINSIPLSIRTVYSYSRHMVAITPRGDPSLVPQLVNQIQEKSPVPVERIVLMRASATQVKALVGKWQFFVFGLKPQDMRYLMGRYGTKSIQGRLPKIGAPEAVISEPVARNKQVKIGDVILSPDTPDNYSPVPVRVVGIAKSDEWFILNDYTYQRDYHFPKVDAMLVFAHNLKDQKKLDKWAYNFYRGQKSRAQVLAHFRLEEEAASMFETLFVILDVVIGTLVLVITVMMGMLMNIFQSQRLVEFGLLQAIGYTKMQLVRRVVLETITVLLAGWVLGLAIGYGLLVLVKHFLMDPRGFAISTWDPMAIRYTVPVPIAILLVASLTIYFRFRNFDPVAVVERRLV